jgi:prepilin signal peptidase PulO-like enzyme (type II secretory pathway)
VEFFVAAVIGACMGSFGNVLVDRLPVGESILGRSRCDGCKRALSPFELVPLFSWVFLRAKCRTCGERIPKRVPFVECFSALLAVFAVYHAVTVPAIIALFVALWALLLIAVIDTRTRTIPDVLTFAAFAAGLAYQWFATGTVPVAAPLIAASFFGAQWLLSRGRWVGSGDILLAAATGMLVGTPHGALWLLIASYAIGANVAIVLILRKKLSRGDMIPFGPFLVVAAYVVIFAGDGFPRIV